MSTQSLNYFPTRVPNEIIELILEQFSPLPAATNKCERCLGLRCTCILCPRGCTYEEMELWRLHGRGEITSLSLTCKHLNKLAARCRYQWLTRVEKHPLLSRTLICRPDLAEMVRLLRFEIDFYSIDHQMHIPVDYKAPEELVKYFNDKLTNLPSLVGNPWADSLPTATNFPFFDTSMVTMLISLCPNIERLEISLAIDHWAHGLWMIKYNSFPKLKSLQLANAWDFNRHTIWRFFISRLGYIAPNLECIEVFQHRWNLYTSMQKTFTKQSPEGTTADVDTGVSSALKSVKRLIFTDWYRDPELMELLLLHAQNAEEVHCFEGQYLYGGDYELIRGWFPDKVWWMVELILSSCPKMKRLTFSLHFNLSDSAAGWFEEAFAVAKERLEGRGVEFVLRRSFQFRTKNSPIPFMRGHQLWDGNAWVLPGDHCLSSSMVQALEEYSKERHRRSGLCGIGL